MENTIDETMKKLEEARQQLDRNNIEMKIACLELLAIAGMLKKVAKAGKGYEKLLQK
jgi:hypothetical protein